MQDASTLVHRSDVICMEESSDGNLTCDLINARGFLETPQWTAEVKNLLRHTKIEVKHSETLKKKKKARSIMVWFSKSLLIASY